MVLQKTLYYVLDKYEQNRDRLWKKIPMSNNWEFSSRRYDVILNQIFQHANQANGVIKVNVRNQYYFKVLQYFFGRFHPMKSENVGQSSLTAVDQEVLSVLFAHYCRTVSQTRWRGRTGTNKMNVRHAFEIFLIYW